MKNWKGPLQLYVLSCIRCQDPTQQRYGLFSKNGTNKSTLMLYVATANSRASRHPMRSARSMFSTTLTAVRLIPRRFSSSFPTSDFKAQRPRLLRPSRSATQRWKTGAGPFSGSEDEARACPRFIIRAFRRCSCCLRPRGVV